MVAAVGFANAQQVMPDPPARPLMPRPEGQAPGPLMGEAPGAQMPGADPFQLLENSKQVQADLGLTADQLAKLSLAARNFHTKLQELSFPKPGESPAAAQAAIDQHLMDTRAMIARELTPPQLARLQQIMLQLEGPCLSMIDTELARQLGLTPDQMRKIGDACRARSDEMRAAFRPPPPGGDFCRAMDANRVQIEQIRAREDKRIFVMLSGPQQKMFERMSGRKLHLDPPRPPQCR